MINVEETIISQYGNSASITQLIRGIDNYLDPRADIELFIEKVWDITTAETWGLDVWGKIVGVPRYVYIPEPLPIPPGSATRTFYIPDEDYRGYILFKAITNISNCSTPSINSLLSNKFEGQGIVSVEDGNDMSMRFVFDFILSSWETALFVNGELVPRATGVKLYVQVGDSATAFSFFESTTGFGFSVIDGGPPTGGGSFSVLI